MAFRFVLGSNQRGGFHETVDLGLEVPTGKCTCLMGRNGVGKTTLLKSIMGLLPTEPGDDTSIVKVRAEQRASLGMGYVPQGRQIFSLMTATTICNASMKTVMQRDIVLI